MPHIHDPNNRWKAKMGNQKAVEFAEKHPLWNRAIGVAGCGFCAVLPVTVAATAGVGTATGVLLTAFAGAVGAGVFSYAGQTDRLAAAEATRKKFNLTDSKPESVHKLSVAAMAVFGSLLSGSITWSIMEGQAETKAVDALPELNPYEVVAVKTETKETLLHEVLCQSQQAGNKVRVTRDGRDYSIICPK